jgi:hypothetical protein
MDGQRFDKITRRWATRRVRRRSVLRALTGGALSGLILHSVSEPSQAQYSCDSDSVIFSDGFDSGTLAKWDNPQGLDVQQGELFAGRYAVRAEGSGEPHFARTGLGGRYRDLYYRIKFNAITIPANEWVYLMTFRTAGDVPILGFAIEEGRRLVYRNNVEDDPSLMVPGVQSATRVTLGSWHELQARLTIDGANGRVRVWLDGYAVEDMSNTENFGSEPIGRIQFGESLSYRSFNVVFDEVVVATSFCGDYFENTAPPPAPPQQPPPPPQCVDGPYCSSYGCCPGGTCSPSGACCHDYGDVASCSQF